MNCYRIRVYDFAEKMFRINDVDYGTFIRIRKNCFAIQDSQAIQVLVAH